MRIKRRRMSRLSGPARSVVLGLGVWAGSGAAAQVIENPVYLDDSTSATATLERLGELVSRGSISEAVRAIQQLLDDEADRLLPSADHPEVFVTVRRRVHAELLARPDLLARYREAQEPAAAEALRLGRHERVERSWLLTRSGLEAAMRVAQLHLESARFDAARRALEQLETHPDRRGEAAGEAADLAGLVAKYADDAPSRSLAARWAAALGRPAVIIEPVRAPDRASHTVSNAATGADGWTGVPVRVDLVLQEPLESVVLTAGDTSDALGNSAMQPTAWTMPAIAGDLLYLNDGETISAWDRFTFRPVWRVRTVDDADAPSFESVLRARRISLGRNLEDPTSVTVHGDLLLAVSGRANGGERRGDPRLHAFDRHTGARLWTVDPEAVDSSLNGGSIRGPVVVSDGVVVVAVRKMLRRRRLVSVLLVGLDLYTGQTRWVRQIASTGSLPFQQFSPLPVGLAERDGIVFVTDVLGAAGAVEAATGRVQWVTRLPSDPFLTNRARHVWTAGNPVPDGETVVLITPDMKWVSRLDARTGVVLGRREASAFGEPAYLLGAGPWLVAVGLRSVAVVPIDSFESDEVRSSPTVPEPGFRGRVVPSGDTLTVPVADGLLLLDPSSPGVSPRQVVPLTQTGNALVLEGQAVIVDESSAHNFLAWDVASTLLERRLNRDPNDPGPALIYAELAFRAGQIGKLIEITDRAIGAVERLDAEAGEIARDRLFDALAAMAAPVTTREVWGTTLGPADPAPMIQDAEVISELLDRLGSIAVTPQQRVVHLLAQGDLDSKRGQAAAALDRYQRVLSEPELAESQWRGGPLVVRAHLEAKRRLEALLREHGLGVYEGFERAAQAESLAVDLSNVVQVEGVASRYPAAGVTPGLWLRAGVLRLEQGDGHEAIRDLREGLEVVARRLDAGATTEPETVAELLGRLARALVDRQQLGSAGEVVALAREYGVEATVEGLAIDLGSTLAEHPLEFEIPRLGRSLTERVSLLPGEPVVPMHIAPSAPRRRVLLVSPVASTLMLAEPDEHSGELAVRWSRRISRAMPVVLRSDADSVVLLRPRLSPGSGGSLESIDAHTGEARWRSESFDEAVRGPAPARGGRVTLPSGDQEAWSQLLVLVEDTTAVLLERSGRAVAYDLVHGSVMWTKRLGVTSIVDAVLSDGILLAGGNNAEDGPLGPSPALVSVEVLTGEVLQRIDGLSTPTRWIRDAGSGVAAVGLGGSVLVLDLRAGLPRWTSTVKVLRGSIDAWVLGDTLTVLTDQSTPWLIDLETGRLRTEPLETMGRLGNRLSVRVGQQSDRMVLSTDRGVAIFDSTGELVGLDPFDMRRSMLPVGMGDGVLAALTVQNERGIRLEIEAHLLDSASGRLLDSRAVSIPPELRTVPSSVHVIDGAVLIGFGSATLVVETGPGE